MRTTDKVDVEATMSARYFRYLVYYTGNISIKTLYNPALLLSKKNINLIFRTARSVIGALLLAIIVTTIVTPQILPVTGKSIVNAKVEKMRTPIEGNVFFDDIKLGQKFNKDDYLGRVVNKRADDNFLNQLTLERSALKSQISNLEHRLYQLQSRGMELENAALASQQDITDQTRIRLDTTHTNLQLAKDREEMLEDKIDRYEQANQSYSDTQKYAIVSRAKIESLSSELSAERALIDTHENTIAMLITTLDAVREGQFTMDATPLETQQLKEVKQSIRTIRSEKRTLSEKIDKLSQEILKRTDHVDLMRQHELKSRVSGTVWTIEFSDGSYVNNGDTLLSIADSSSITVEGIFHQRYLDNISVGDHATVDLMGSKERLTGTVSKILIRDQVKLDNLSAFRLNNLQIDEFKVIVQLSGTQDIIPQIGQRAKIVINDKPNSLFVKLLTTFNR